MKNTIALLVLVAGAASSALAQAPIDDKARQGIETLAKAHKGWGPRMNSPGVAVETRELGRRDLNGQTAVTYQVYVNGLPKDLRYTLVMWPINGQVTQVLENVRLDDNGRAVVDPPSGSPPEIKDDPIDLVVLAGLGEPKRFGLVSVNPNLRAMFTLTPFPIRAEDNGCSLEAVLLAPDSEILFIRGSGFDGEAEVQFESNSEGELQVSKFKTDSDGNVDTVILPYVLGKDSGTVQIGVPTAKCKPQISVRWGRGTYKVQ